MTALTALYNKATLVSLEGTARRSIKSDPLQRADGGIGCGHAVLREPLRILSQARNYLRGRAIGIGDGKRIPDGLTPWDSKGWYILPNIIHKQVSENLCQFEEDGNDAVAKLLEESPEEVAVKARAVAARRSNREGKPVAVNYALSLLSPPLYTFTISFATIPDQYEVTL